VGLLDGFLRLKTGDSSLTLVRDFILYAIVAGALARWLVSGAQVTPPPLTGWVLLWVAVVLVQIPNPGDKSLVHAISGVRPHLEFVPLFFFGFAVMRTKARLRAFLFALVVIAAINGVVGFIQFHLTPDQLASWGPGYRNRIQGVGVGARFFIDEFGAQRTRPFGLGSDTGFGGIVGLLAAPAVVVMIGLASRRRATALATLPLAVGVVAAVITSQARVAVLGSVIAIVIYAALSTVSRRIVPLIVGLAVAGVLAVLAVGLVAGNGSAFRYASITPDKALSTTYQSRKATFENVPLYIRKYPLGAGLGSVGPGFSGSRGEDKGLNGESEFTYLLVEVGIPGLLVLLLFNLRVFAGSLRRIHKLEDPELRTLLAAVTAGLLALFVTWIIGPSTAAPPGSPYFWFVTGVLSYWLFDRSAVTKGTSSPTRT
jgi:hypothetical protein